MRKKFNILVKVTILRFADNYFYNPEPLPEDLDMINACDSFKTKYTKSESWSQVNSNATYEFDKLYTVVNTVRAE